MFGKTAGSDMNGIASMSQGAKIRQTAPVSALFSNEKEGVAKFAQLLKPIEPCLSRKYV